MTKEPIATGPLRRRGSRVAGKRAFVTGAAQGLGAAIACGLAEEGATVALTDLDGNAVREQARIIRERCGDGAAIALPLDVTSEQEWMTSLEQVCDALGGLSILVNNAGIQKPGTIEQLSLEHWRQIMAVNADGTFLGIKHALPILRENGPASIINISSVAAMIGSPAAPAYNASKAAVWTLTKSVALHCAREGYPVRCNSVHPGFIETPFLDDFRRAVGRDKADAQLASASPMGMIGTPLDVAQCVLYLASDESLFVTGAEFKVDGGATAR